MYLQGDQILPVPENLSFSKFVLDGLRAIDGDKICLVNGLTRESLTYKEAIRYAVKLSVGLLKLGVRRGDLVAIGCKPFLHYVPTALAVIFTGATLTAYEESLGTVDLEHRLNLTKPKYLISTSTFWQKHKNLILSFDCIKTYIAVDDFPDFEISLTSLVSMNEDVNVETFEPAPVEEHKDTLVIYFSTGTTNVPKGIKRSHYNELSNLVLRGFENMTPVTTVLVTGPWSLLYYNSVTYKTMLLGRKIVFAPAARPVKTILQILRDCEVQAIFGTPEYFCEMANNSHPSDDYFESLKVIYCGGTSLKAKMAEKIEKSFPKVDIRITFGCTECGVMTRNISGDYSKPGSIGRVCAGRIIKVVELETRALLAPNQIGEICVKSPTFMQGYVNLELADYVDEDNFFMTGDLGYYDENMNLFFVERISNIIWWQGHKVSPGELENVLLQHPAVYDVVVIGRRAPVVKEVPVAIVVKKPDTDVSEEELIEFVASQVSPPMELRGGVMFVSEIPKIGSGKPMRFKLKEMINKDVVTQM